MKEELQVIMDLMKDLQDKMQFGDSDLSERLGRDKPMGMEVMKVEGDPMSSPMGMNDDDGDEEADKFGGGMNDYDGDEAEEMDDSPEARLKSRLMKLRSA